MFKGNGIAMLEWVGRVKFSTHLPMFVYLCLMLLTGWRSVEVFHVLLHLPLYISVPSGIALELMALAAIAVTFNALRDSYIAELKGEDYRESIAGIVVGYILNIGVLVMLVAIALYDAQYKTNDPLGVAVLVIVQFCQALMTISLLVAGVLEERKNLRSQLEQWQIEEEQRQRELSRQRKSLEERTLQEEAGKCRWCKKPFTPNNIKKHIEVCLLNPANI